MARLCHKHGFGLLHDRYSPIIFVLWIVILCIFARSRSTRPISCQRHTSDINIYDVRAITAIFLLFELKTTLMQVYHVLYSGPKYVGNHHYDRFDLSTQAGVGN